MTLELQEGTEWLDLWARRDPPETPGLLDHTGTPVALDRGERGGYKVPPEMTAEMEVKGLEDHQVSEIPK